MKASEAIADIMKRAGVDLPSGDLRNSPGCEAQGNG